MARPRKQAVDYFPVVVGFEYNNKIALMIAEYGISAAAVIILLFCRIYGQQGYYYPWTKKEKLLFSRASGLPIKLVDSMIDSALEYRLFDAAKFNSYEILTSESIQLQYIRCCERRDRIEIARLYLLINVSEYKNVVIVDINSVNANIGTQSKGNRKESKSNKTSSADAAPVKDSFKKVEEKTLYWKSLTDVWFDFHIEKKLEAPSFKGQDPRELKSICTELSKRVESNGNTWTEITAPGALKMFFEKAWDCDPWLQKNFLLPTIARQFDKIIQVKPELNGNKSIRKDIDLNPDLTVNRKNLITHEISR